MKENINSGKKVVILVSIIFSIIIVLIGVTTAFFSQGDSQTTGNIVTVDELSLEYNDDTNNYMRQGLIPSSKENAITAYNREADKKCLDMNDYSTCSIYRFSVKNTSEVPQLLRMSLHPTGNSYKNLKFMLYEVAEEGNILIKDKTDLIQYSVDPITILEAYTLGIDNEDNEKTFEVVFYIEAKDYDQTEEDAGKQFGAGIRIDSITSGKYIAQGFGENCWETYPKDRTKLVKFNGINMDESVVDDIDPMCSSYVSKDDNGYYSINIPSNVGGQDVTIIGNNLFNAIGDIGEDGPILNKYGYIKEINIEEGIKEIEDGDMDFMKGSFVVIGFGIEDENYSFNVKLPNTLTKIGNSSFLVSSLNSISVPHSVETIGAHCFRNNYFLTSVKFGIDNDGNSRLKEIGDNAFYDTEITSITIPSSVETIGELSFFQNSTTGLNELIFEGASDGTSQLKSIGFSAFSCNNFSSITIPSSVVEIGEEAFDSNPNLTTITFMGALDGTSKLQTIGERAFNDCDLTYEANINPLILPSTITAIGKTVFYKNTNLKYIYFPGDTTGFGDLWHGNATVITKFPNNNHLNVVG